MSIFSDWFGHTPNLEPFKGISMDITDSIKNLKSIVDNYHQKVALLSYFVKNWDKGDLDKLIDLMRKLKKICKFDVSYENGEEKYILRAISKINKIIDRNKTSHKLAQSTLDDLKSFKTQLHPLSKILLAQFDFFEKYDDKLMLENKNIDQLSKLVKQEGILLFDIKISDEWLPIDYLRHIRLRVNSEISNSENLFMDNIGPEDASVAKGLIFQEKNARVAYSLFLQYSRKKILNLRTLNNKDIAFKLYNEVYFKTLLQIIKDELILKQISREKLIGWLNFIITTCMDIELNGENAQNILFESSNLLIKLDSQNYNNFISKAKFILNTNQVVTNYDDAIKDLEYARQLFPQNNVELLKLKSRLMARKVNHNELYSNVEPTEKEKNWRKIGNINSAEAAYSKILNLLSNLDLKHNREILADAFRTAGYEKIIEADFQGAKLTKLDRKELEKIYGVKIYPITLVVSTDKWQFLKGKNLDGMYKKLNLEGWIGGVNISSKKFAYPFNQLGGIRILSESHYDPHEDLHGTFDIYQLSTHPIINEIFAYRTNVRDGTRTWRGVSSTLIDRYVSYFYPKINNKERKQLKKEIKQACKLMFLMQSLWDEKKISSILLKCNNLEDLLKYKDDLNKGKKIKNLFNLLWNY